MVKKEEFNYNLEKNFVLIIYYILKSSINNKNESLRKLINSYRNIFIVKHHKNIIESFLKNEYDSLSHEEKHFLSRVHNLELNNELKNFSITFFLNNYKENLNK